MGETRDNAGVIAPPPLIWAVLFAAALGLDRLWAVPLLPTEAEWAGALPCAGGLALALWGVTVIQRAGSRVEPHRPTTTIVTAGPYRFSRNPIYLGLFLFQAGLTIGLNSLWLLAGLVLMVGTIRYGVVAREEIYLERKFGDRYRDYKARVHRWL